MTLQDALEARENGAQAYNDGVDWRTGNPFDVEDERHGLWLAAYWERHNLVMGREPV